MDTNTGIYQILNTINNKRYIGSAINIEKRFQTHQKPLQNNKHYNPYLQNAWNKYGESAFKFEILLFCDEKNLLFYEQSAIDMFQVTNDLYGYNICSVAGNTKGRQFSKETLKKMSISSKGQIAWNKGKSNIYSKETLEKMAIARRGKPSWNAGIPHSKATKQKISKINKGAVPWNKGVPCSEETKKKIAEGNKNKEITTETRLKMSVAQKRRNFSEEHKRNISKGLKGHLVSEETKRKISKHLTGRHYIGKPHTEAAKRKMSESHKGKQLPEETKRKIAKSMKLARRISHDARL